MFDYTQNSQATKLIECEITGLPFMPSSKKDLHISFVAKFWSKVDRIGTKMNVGHGLVSLRKTDMVFTAKEGQKLRPILPIGYRTC